MSIDERIGITCSTFDLLHTGHILMLKEAKTQCDYLIAALQVDPSYDRDNKNKPVQTLQERRIQLEAVKYVDEVIVYTTERDLMELLIVTPHDVRIVGEEYRNKDFTGKEWSEDRLIDIYYNSRDHDYSSTSLRKRVKLAELGK
jgi:glycerol-3-phosphate cytidylyltransferase